MKDTITGLLLAGIGHVERGKKNFLVVDTSEYQPYMRYDTHSNIRCRDTSVRHRSFLPRVHRTERHCHPPHKPTRTSQSCTYPSKRPIMKYDTVLQVAEKIRPTVDKYQQAFPALLEIPSKDHPYGASASLHCPAATLSSLTSCSTDPSKDSVLKRVQKLFGD